MDENIVRPAHGCYKCRRDAPGEKGCLRMIREQHGCSAYPDFDVRIYECTICRGLWLATQDSEIGGCIMTLREDHAREMFPDLLAK
jgi:hypothetical protein